MALVGPAANFIHSVKSGVESNSFSVLQTLRANTNFLDLPAVQRVTAETTMAPQTLRERVATLYVCLPEHELKPVAWLHRRPPRRIMRADRLARWCGVAAQR